MIAPFYCKFNILIIYIILTYLIYYKIEALYLSFN